jgi:hypothetical protein
MVRAIHIAEDLLAIADDGTNDYMEYEDKEGNAAGWRFNGEHVQRSRLRVDARKWLLSKLLPKFADKPEPNTDDQEPEPTEVVINVQDARKY